MPRVKKSGTVGEVTYTVRRATRLEPGQEVFLKKRIADALDETYPALRVDLEDYCKIAVNATVQGLVTVDDESVRVPDYFGTDAEHLTAFKAFLRVEPDITNAILAEVEAINAPTGPRELLPESELTEEEKSDEDFLEGEPTL